MALVKKSKIPTNYVLPVKIEHRNGVTAMNYYYEDKKTLYKAYNQLKHIKNSELEKIFSNSLFFVLLFQQPRFKLLFFIKKSYSKFKSFKL